MCFAAVSIEIFLKEPHLNETINNPHAHWNSKKIVNKV
jgi:hypothetical protein